MLHSLKSPKYVLNSNARCYSNKYYFCKFFIIELYIDINRK